MQRKKKTNQKKQKSLLLTLDNLHSKETATIPRNSYSYLMGGGNRNKILLSMDKYQEAMAVSWEVQDGR